MHVAERLCRDSLESLPGDEELLCLLGVVLQLDGRPAEAVKAYRELVSLKADCDLHWSNLGTALREAEALDEAAAAYRRALEIHPDNSETLYNFGLLLMQQQDYPEALAMLLRGHRLAPTSSHLRIQAANAAWRCRNMPAAEYLLSGWKQWFTPREPAIQRDLADLLLSLGDVGSAEMLLKDLVAKDPTDLHSRIRLVGVYERSNQVAEASSLLQQLPEPDQIDDIERRRQMLDISASLAIRSKDYSTARTALEQSISLGKPESHRYFALAQVYDREGNVDQAMQMFTLAHAQKISELQREVPDRFTEGATLLPAADGQVDASQYRRWPAIEGPPVEASPIFIVGFPRSGTTLLEQMLDAHPALRSMDERPFFNQLASELDQRGITVPEDLFKLRADDCDALRALYWRLVSERVNLAPGQRLVDKNPLNMVWLPLIHRLFPQARIILALRHPCDVVLSCYMQNFYSAILGVASETLETLATTYDKAMQHWIHHVALFNPPVLELRYEELTADPKTWARRIGDFVDLDDASPLLEFDHHALNKSYIGTPSYAQVIEPINRRAIDRWRRYRRYLEPVLPILRPMIQHWRYSE